MGLIIPSVWPLASDGEATSRTVRTCLAPAAVQHKHSLRWKECLETNVVTFDVQLRLGTAYNAFRVH